MDRNCSNCIHWQVDTLDSEGSCKCDFLHVATRPAGCCPACKTLDMTDDAFEAQQEEARKMREQVLAMHPSTTAPVQKVNSKPNVSRKVSASTPVELDPDTVDQVTLFKHQQDAFEKFKDSNEIALFFEMGCGKTVTCCSIAAYKFKQGMINAMLVVAPNDVHKQWFDDLINNDSLLARKFKQEGIEISCQIIGGRGGQKQFYDFSEFVSDDVFKIVVVNIDTFSTPTKWQPIVEWATNDKNKTMLVIDEATVIKNPSSKRAQRMLYEFNYTMKRGKSYILNEKKESTMVRAVLTGTPVTNGPIDLWAIMEFVRPNYFGRNYYSFMGYYGMHTKLDVTDGTGHARSVQVLLTEKTWKGINSCDTFMEAYSMFGCSEDTYLTVKSQDHYMGPYKHADELKQLLEPVSVFAKLVDCVDMPPVNYIVRNVGLSPVQEACYNNMKRELLAQYEEYTTTAKNKLVSAIRLQQISSGFIMGQAGDLDAACWSDDESYDVTPEEVVWLGDSNPRLDALLRDVDELDKPLLIMTRFSAEAAKIYELLKDKYNTCLITGWKTVGSIPEFKEGKYDIMVCNLAKIARGHNLQCAHTTLYYSNTFSMELRQQSEFRTFRIGQTFPCTYIDYVSCDIDRTIHSALKLKKGLLEYIREKEIKDIV